MTFKQQEKEMKLIQIVNQHIYLSNKYRIHLPANSFPDDILKALKKLFFEMWKDNIIKRTSNIIVGEKEKEFLKYCFEWTICSPDFKGDLKKGLFIASKQGFGKDVMLNTIQQFYEFFLYKFKSYSYFDFCKVWFDNDSYMFNSPVIIKDVYDNGKMKREKESIPFLEFLDYREQTSNRRSILASSNFTPEALQELLESDKQEKRLKQRIIECCNIVLIKDAESKRVEEMQVI
jgi:hypothetical protein